MDFEIMDGVSEGELSETLSLVFVWDTVWAQDHMRNEIRVGWNTLLERGYSVTRRFDDQHTWVLILSDPVEGEST